MSPHERVGARRRGFALITVLFVLLALLVLCAPFLMTARNADESSRHVGDRAQLALSQDAAERHARAVLAASHPALDTTRDHDSLEELDVDNEFDPAFLDARDARGVMWDVEVRDESGLIDLDSASPQVIANALGLVALLTQVVGAEDDRIPVTTTRGFAPRGLLSIEGELVLYAATEGNAFVGCQRGIGVRYDQEGSPLPEGPQPPSNHGIGVAVFDQRVEALALWRIMDPVSGLRRFDAPEQVVAAGEFVHFEEPNTAAGLAAADLLRLSEIGSVYAGLKGGAVWQHPARLLSRVEGGVTQTIEVSEPRWFNEGSTLRIRDGLTSELRLVHKISGGQIVLDRVLGASYDAFTAEVSVLAKRPVNLNTAGEAVLLVLFENLSLRGRNARVSRGEAQKLAAEVVRRRPFTGHEDFMRRLVLPAAGLAPAPQGEAELEAFLSEQDALALYANGLNANDVLLAYSTLPFAWSAREVYGLELRAAVNAESGVQRASSVRERTQLVAPQRPLFHLWHRQADFDEALRLSREAPWWATGPLATSRYDGLTVPPSRLTPHFGSVEGHSIVSALFEPASFDGNVAALEPAHVFASTEPDGFTQLWPARVDESTPARAGRVLHFDHETRDLEGRYLPDQIERFAPDDGRVGWVESDAPLLLPLSFEAWVRPTTQADGSLLDVGATSNETDRLQLLLEGGDLVLRVIDGFGDHSATAAPEVGEVRFPLAAGDTPGLPTDVWSHVFIDVRGNQPSQMTLLVNGLAHGVRRPGMSRLAAGVGQDAAFLPLESTEGFALQGVAKLGNELVEYVLTDGGLLCQHNETGPLAGFGGRQARTRWTLDDFPVELAEMDTSHPAGTMVEQYGYSLALTSNLPSGGSALPQALGVWRVAEAATVMADGMPSGGDPIVFPFIDGFGTVGLGIENAEIRPAPFDLQLEAADDPESGDTRFMQAFQERGGYAILVQEGDLTINQSVNERTLGNSRLGGMEVIRYSGYEDDRLKVVARGPQVRAELQRLAGTIPYFDDQGRNAFVTEWYSTYGGEFMQNIMRFGLFVVPISLSVPGSGAFTGFLDPLASEEGWSELAQITRVDEGEMTEWVRYDEIARDELVRCDPDALRALYDVLTGSGPSVIDVGADDGGGGGGRSGGGGDQSPGGAPAAPPAPSAQAAGSSWVPVMGAPEDDDFPLTRAAREVLRFRGVFGTHSHSHEAGTAVLPVFRCLDSDAGGSLPEGGLASGLPGAKDAVFVVGSEADHLGWPLVVHRAHRPWPVSAFHGWDQVEGEQRAQATGGSGSLFEDQVIWESIYVALEAECPEPMGASLFPGAQAPMTDSRLLTRLVKFPSGELPRAVAGVGLGAGFGEGSNASVLSALVDEVVFGAPRFARGTAGALPASATQGGQLVLAGGVGAGETSLTVWKGSVRTSLWLHTVAGELLTGLPEDGGLLLVGEEIMAYASRDPALGTVGVLASGRGLLGTAEVPHQRGEPVSWLEHFPVTTLAADVSSGDASLPVVDVAEFPPQGLLLLEDELVHYTRIRSGVLEMPRASSEPGAMDAKGAGLFRGRFGTAASGHPAGAPVILFPFRYWDRWARRADAPELAYFGLELDEPAGWFESYFFDWQPAVTDGARVGVLLRAREQTPWDADPQEAEGLWLAWDGRPDGREIPIGMQSDRLQWRVFVEYEPGAFDPLTGLAHGWKATPRFSRLGVSYVAPGRVLRSVER